MSKQLNAEEFLNNLLKQTKGSKLFSKQPEKVPNEAWVADLVRVIQECRAMNQGQRFGQLLYNLITRGAYDKGNVPTNEDFHSLQYEIYDEDLAALVKQYGETGKL